ncbi:MAG TPA: sigma-54-dependent Fis family transcriptional regulator [Oceanospirillaceae bacterium]|jgi:two-component system C4-dicarboxylate transport response regulator DctD|nr:sigma-54-dependent Fis family transcriptional regulator [Oceanospirillaceae bacterium]
MTLPTICVVDDHEEIRNSLVEMLELADYQVTAYASAEAALPHLLETWPGIVISDIRMPNMDGFAFLAALQKTDTDLPVILITGHGDIQMALGAIRSGAYDFIEKPFRREHLLEVVKRALDKRQLVMENRHLKAAIAAQDNEPIIGQSSAINLLKQKISRLAQADVNTLICGETGTGKELAARRLHEQSARSTGPFVAINCAALPESMMEAELFGHEAGAFTDAKKARIGKFEYAHKGTIFLDEVESIPLSLAVKILRVLQERKVERLGANHSIDIDIRVVAATKADLKALAQEGKFREDLYYRLNVVELHLPPLRQRDDDIIHLFRYFTAQASEKFNLPEPTLSLHVIDTLMQHPWPGNVRELINVAERFVLTDTLIDQNTLATWQTETGNTSLPERMERYEKRLIEEALSQAQGSIKRTYEGLGIARKTLYDKLAKYNLDRHRFLDD